MRSSLPEAAYIAANGYPRAAVAGIPTKEFAFPSPHTFKLFKPFKLFEPFAALHGIVATFDSDFDNLPGIDRWQSHGVG